MKYASLYSLLVLLLLPSLIACGGRSPSVAYYTLNTIEQESPELENSETFDIAIGIGPVTIPESLKRTHIATRLNDNRLSFNEFHRWSGLLEKDISAVLGDNLGFLLGTDQIAFFPWIKAFKPDYRVTVEIVQFDSNLDGNAVLSARWTVTDADGTMILASGKSRYRQELASSSYLAVVAVESQLLAKLSRELAEELKSLALK